MLSEKDNLKIHTDVELEKGKHYNCLVVNASVGGCNSVCFTKELVYDGNEENGRPIFLQERYNVSRERYSNDYNSPKLVKYNTDTFIVVGIIPDRVFLGKNYMNNAYQYSKILTVTDVTPEDIYEDGEDDMPKC